jgi:hypothetical protein
MSYHRHDIRRVRFLAVRKLLVNIALRELILYGALAIFRSIHLQMKRNLKVRGRKVNTSQQSISHVLVSILASLIPRES